MLYATRKQKKEENYDAVPESLDTNNISDDITQYIRGIAPCNLLKNLTRNK